MKLILIPFLILLVSLHLSAQNSQSPDQIRKEMAKIRQSTNWSDPAAAQKANEDMRKLASQLNGGKPTVTFPGSGKPNSDTTGKAYELKSAVTQSNIVAIADRFFKRSYKALDAVARNTFDIDFKAAAKAEFTIDAVRKLTESGSTYLLFGNDHLIACVYLTAAVKAFPTDTLTVNNFGAYLREIDSTEISIPVLLYANKLFSQSPIILTQLGNSYFELNDYANAESYYKQALKINPEFGQAHASLCDLYIKQNRLQDAILELFAGVKGMGCSYGQVSNNFSYLQSQAENSPNGTSEKEKFWNETRNQMNPPDALAPLVPEVDRLKMPSFGGCTLVTDWMEGGGYGSAVQGYNRFHSQLMKFVNEFQQVHKEVPNLPPNSVLRDYPNERFALDCITEYFFHESQKEADAYEEKVGQIMKKAFRDADSYLTLKESYTKEFVDCANGCSDNAYCINECHRVYCTKECPAANKYNGQLQGWYADYEEQFKITQDKQKKILDDLYQFTAQWFSKIYSPYWSKIYAYEIQRVALTIIGNTYVGYIQAFPSPAHNDCGTDCSKYANPYPIPPEEVKEKKPKGNECPGGMKIKFSAGPCDLGLDCESIEFGCAEGVAASIKRNFVKKTTTGFIGAGFKGGAGFVSAGIQAGMQITVSDNNEVQDAGFKFDASAGVAGGPVRAGGSTSGSFTIMTGFQSKANLTGGGKFE